MRCPSVAAEGLKELLPKVVLVLVLGLVMAVPPSCL